MISGDFTERYDRGRLQFSVESEPGCVSWKGRPKLRRLQVSLIDISCLRHLPFSDFRPLRPSEVSGPNHESWSISNPLSPKRLNGIAPPAP